MKMPREHQFVQLDVFTQTPLAGNPLAIFPDARVLSDEQMQALAREMNLSETTFILPRQPAVEAKQGKRVRIFTIEEELPFAGHPTLGTALYLHSAGGSAANAISLDLNVGRIDIRFRPDSESERASTRVDGKVFGEMRQRDPEFGPSLPREKVGGVLASDGAVIASEWPCQVVSTGVSFAIVPIRDVKTLSTLQADLTRMSDLLKGTGAKFCYFIAREDRQGHVRARMFFYGGEDPATGSAAGCAISWMVQYGWAKVDEQIVIHQGVEARRPSEIYVRASRAGDKIDNVRVGGYAVEVLRGTVSF